MKLNFRTLFAFLLFPFVFAIHAQDDTRISATWQVQKYDISATLPQSDADRNLTVKAKLDIKNVSSRPPSTLTLRISPDATVSAVAINGANVDFSKGEEKIGAGSLQRIVIRIPPVQPNGTIAATVDYKLNIKENSGINAISPVGSQFLPLSFWYPTPNSWFFARGADYAPVKLQIISAVQTAIASGAETGGVFDQKIGAQPFFLTGNWDTANAGGVMVYMPKGADADAQKRAAELAALASEARTFTAVLLGTAPDMPIKIVAAKRGAGFSSGGTILIDDSVFRRSRIDSQAAMTIAESIAKMWIGGSISASGDGNGVIREGLPKFIATQFIESKFGKDVADVERLRQRVAYASVARRDSPLNIVSPLDDYYYSEVANKGAMIWRLLAKKLGQDGMFAAVRSNAQDGNLSISELRSAFSPHKEFLDYMFDQITETNLQAGLPQVAGADTKIALRNTGPIDVTVNVGVRLANGERMSAPATIPATSYGEVIFKAPAKIVRVEIDPEKLYPQTEYSDDVAPREVTDSDLLLAVKRSFDKQDFANAEKTARTILQEFPRFDDVRILLARSLSGLGRSADAEKEFRAVLDEKLPTSRSLAWANAGLGEIALKNGQNAPAAKFAEAAILADAEYGASLAARALRSKLGSAAAVDESVKAYFSQFDKVAASNRKADLDQLIVPGEASKFASGISGQTVEWSTQVLNVDKIDANNVLVGTNVTIKLLNREAESGTAVYRLSRSGSGWKLSSVDIFEVR